ncbi:YqeG family HAD IIIA-type phosphatase [Defluviitalea phaphyphila]|uniref:YqeG family HAD IIIA-type phosphatase n=1 Tax=Defluviitalea phaphyphila TaxID=1473580 RepID=UPI0007317B7B|nr:YqeG family HAD IIIA-type phosphatase [Defluviitalea phaphyphila]
MLRRLFPTDYIDSVFDLDIKDLKEKKIKGLIFDIDNTLAPFDIEYPNKKLINFFKKLKEEGFKICLMSNNTEERVIKFNEKLKVYTIHKAAKPRRRSFKKAMQLMNTNKDSTVIIGDQIFTDVWGGNRVGIMTILVVPISERDEWITKIKRGLEKIIINIYLATRKVER